MFLKYVKWVIAIKTDYTRTVYHIRNGWYDFSSDTIGSTEDFTGIATVAVKVEFQRSFSLSCISEPPMQKVQQALCKSLAGNELGDTKFCLFARRTVEGQVIRPQVNFSNSSLY